MSPKKGLGRAAAGKWLLVAAVAGLVFLAILSGTDLGKGRGAVAGKATAQGAYTPDSYAEELTRLKTSDAASSVTLAIETYRKGFAGASQEWRDQAFRAFLDFHAVVIAGANSVLQEEIEKIRSTRAGDFSHEAETIIPEKNRSEQYRTAGLTAVHDGEGSWIMVPREGFYTKLFGDYVSLPYREYLALQDVEVHHPWALDAAIVIPLPELGRRIGAWEDYLTKYPESPFAEVARTTYDRFLYALLFGIDNSPIVSFDQAATKKIRPEVVSTLQDFAKERAGTASGALVGRWVAAMEKHKFILTDKLQSELKELWPQQKSGLS